MSPALGETVSRLPFPVSQEKVPGFAVNRKPGDFFPLAGFDLIGFDTALARGPIDFPFPRRYGPGSGAFEFVKATAAASDPATDQSASNRRPATLHRRPDGAHHVRDRPFRSDARGRFT